LYDIAMLIVNKQEPFLFNCVKSKFVCNENSRYHFPDIFGNEMLGKIEVNPLLWTKYLFRFWDLSPCLARSQPFQFTLISR